VRANATLLSPAGRGRKQRQNGGVFGAADQQDAFNLRI
jgi:hypothetical protein